MNKVYGLAATTMLAAAVTFPALAIEQPEGSEVQEQTGTGMQQPAAEVGPQQRVTGIVTEINQSKGSLTLASWVGPLKLHFPPQSVRDVKKGDWITAQFAFAKAGTPEGSARAYDMPTGRAEHRMTGTVRDVDDKGWLVVETEHTTLELHFPAEVLHDLEKGDRITVDMAFSKGS